MAISSFFNSLRAPAPIGVPYPQVESEGEASVNDANAEYLRRLESFQAGHGGLAGSPQAFGQAYAQEEAPVEQGPSMFGTPELQTAQAIALGNGLPQLPDWTRGLLDEYGQERPTAFSQFSNLTRPVLDPLNRAAGDVGALAFGGAAVPAALLGEGARAIGLDTAADNLQGAARLAPKVGQFVGESIAPKNTEQLFLEALPVVGVGPDIVRGVNRIGRGYVGRALESAPGISAAVRATGLPGPVSRMADTPVVRAGQAAKKAPKPMTLSEAESLGLLEPRPSTFKEVPEGIDTSIPVHTTVRRSVNLGTGEVRKLPSGEDAWLIADKNGVTFGFGPRQTAGTFEEAVAAANRANAK